MNLELNRWIQNACDIWCSTQRERLNNCKYYNRNMSADRVEERLRQLELLFYHGSQEKGSLSIEALLDALLVLYDECCNSTLRRDKNITEFIENGKISFHLPSWKAYANTICQPLISFMFVILSQWNRLALKSSSAVFIVKISNPWAWLEKGRSGRWEAILFS